MPSPTVAQCIDRALEGFALLVAAAESLADEIQYVADLETVWGARLRAVRDARGGEAAQAGVPEAIEALVAEAGGISDPHRAVDWLSTLPQVSLAALGEAP